MNRQLKRELAYITKQEEEWERDLRDQFFKDFLKLVKDASGICTNMKKEREFNEVSDNREVTLRHCRLTYRLIDKLVENEYQRKEYLGLVDKVVERIHWGGVRSLSGDESR